MKIFQLSQLIQKSTDSPSFMLKINSYMIQYLLKYSQQILMIGFLAPNSNNLIFSPISTILVFLSLLFIAQMQTNGTSATNGTIYYCASNCADYVNACYGPSSQQCYACDNRLFNINSQNGVCQTLDQKVIAFHDLQSQSMSISGYQTNKPLTTVCGDYALSGQYTAGDYLSKNFKIPQKYGGHYQLVVKFGIGYIGTWSSSDVINANINGVQYSWNYSCEVLTQQCSSTPVDCFKIITHTLMHDEEQLSINITSSIVTSDPSIQYWGIREMIVGMKTCSNNCEKCYGPLESECLACKEGSYLLGNSCIKKCPVLKIEQSHLCVSSCPSGYFKNSQNCQLCHRDCLTCNNAQSCVIYSDGSTSEPFIQKNLMSFIILFVLGALLLVFIIWKLIISRRNMKTVDDIDNGINDRIIDVDLTNESHKKSPKTPQKLRKQKQQIGFKEANTFSTIKFDNQDYPDQIMDREFEDVGMKWIQSVPQSSEAQLNTHKIAPRKRKTRVKKPQELNSQDSLKIKVDPKDELHDYYNKKDEIDNDKL